MGGLLPFVIALLLSNIQLSIADCRVSTRQDITDPQALILRPGGGIGINAFFMPDDGAFMNIAAGQIVDFNCGGSNFRIAGANVGVGNANGICNSGRIFNVLGGAVDIRDISCDVFPPSVARFTGRTCLGIHREFEIGYMANGVLITLITGCFNQALQATIYTLIEIPPNIDGSQIGFPRPSWIEGDFFSLGGNSLNGLYSNNRQRLTINALLGLPASSTQYVQEGNSLFLARAHLAANADFIFGTQRRATFYFLNAAPKWHSFNEGNWVTMEIDLRRYIINTGRTLQIYTGTHGISTLPHAVTGNPVQLFLFADDNGNRAIPVPQLFWKIAYEPISRTGVVFLGVNNPFLTNVSPYIICPDIRGQISWLTWSPTNITGGYSYCCTVGSFTAATGILSELQVVGLLQ